ncbi:hypothetical protein CC85DRAFT_8826 [Cutaneotrichosporon oleaginosum]|uniref:Uncharacterized protein n=1 Tax=Cutaneotrichosporon oleaginosum TaxID=879819 RepID=A0A0J0XU14_9TREE|nr:uncharacterized protein CC85DRAFT_8826 [Cutaneotrichosporon oleaginosum]KLT44560.1 hypothetical protein CC85DRAFT_8826 [Cutaneotrichosporon oleaginosum]TXT13926.1 hypothetical protein COLE_00119 [Cutaneotrichosporon oleaginosum]
MYHTPFRFPSPSPHRRHSAHLLFSVLAGPHRAQVYFCLTTGGWAPHNGKCGRRPRLGNSRTSPFRPGVTVNSEVGAYSLYPPLGDVWSPDSARVVWTALCSTTTSLTQLVSLSHATLVTLARMSSTASIPQVRTDHRSLGRNTSRGQVPRSMQEGPLHARRHTAANRAARNKVSILGPWPWWSCEVDQTLVASARRRQETWGVYSAEVGRALASACEALSARAARLASG